MLLLDETQDKLIFAFQEGDCIITVPGQKKEDKPKFPPEVSFQSCQGSGTQYKLEMSQALRKAALVRAQAGSATNKQLSVFSGTVTAAAAALPGCLESSALRIGRPTSIKRESDPADAYLSTATSRRDSVVVVVVTDPRTSARGIPILDPHAIVSKARFKKREESKATGFPSPPLNHVSLRAIYYLKRHLFSSGLPPEDLNETRIRQMWGDPMNPMIVALPLSIVYGVIFVTGVFGNVCTCFVIIKHPTMRTATNYYLFSLAVSDLLFLVIGLPEEVYLQWFRYPYVFGEAFCILKALTVEVATNASILVITAFTAERYVAICHPLKAQTMSKLSRSVKIILGIWIGAFVMAVPQVIPIRLNREMNGDVPIADLTFCGVAQNWKHWSQFMLQISSYLFFLAPMVIISVLYVRLGLQLRRTSFKVEKNGRGTRNSQRHDKSNNKSREAVVKMLVAVVIAFFICWAPYHAQRLFSIYSSGYESTEPDETFRMVHFALTTISGILYYVSATINPILYHILCSRFRVAFKVSEFSRSSLRCLFWICRLNSISNLSKNKKDPSVTVNLNCYRFSLYYKHNNAIIYAFAKIQDATGIFVLFRGKETPDLEIMRCKKRSCCVNNGMEMMHAFALRTACKSELHILRSSLLAVFLFFFLAQHEIFFVYFFTYSNMKTV
ncbi:unnamed protein product [Notodromas monacha]|uniref:G-protein coupled receptors family 1 profile domain-containing protein n=1 Tax=Notodromas monacha TaxID=399045 RepID=A0A7R9BRS4_9CRUS|nr:unnamed protein product [Notodromas monacha]CAG0918988.1 unnamed protein product [Notodromas monacha]